MNSILLTDSYKLQHKDQYPEGTTLVFSNFTPRSDNHAPEATKENGVVVFGVQLMLRQLSEHFDKNFFYHRMRIDPASLEGMGQVFALKHNSELKLSVMDDIKSYLNPFTQTDFDTSGFEALWDLGYLPIEVRALDEGTLCPMRVPMLTIHNTLPEFFWITNYLETIISNMLWKPMTSATIAHAYKKILVSWATKTDPANLEFTNWQGHDFSMRGLDSVDAVVASGLGHLTSFTGTDSLPTLWGARNYYGDEDFLAGSVPATEHSVACAFLNTVPDVIEFRELTKDEKTTFSDLNYFKNLLRIYPTGPVSVVSDTFDFWGVLTKVLPQIKDEIMSRDGKLVIRPDSGDPVDIICGIDYELVDVDASTPDMKNIKNNRNSEGFITSTEIPLLKFTKGIKFNGDITYFKNEEERFQFLKDNPKFKGAVEILWDVFGGTVNEQGYKVLDSHIGLIYGDSITLERAEEILKRLEAKGFASTNVVLGIGSFTYQFNTRDTFGFAMKATYVEKTMSMGNDFEGEPMLETMGFEIFKDPKTDSGLKKSAKGLLRVVKNKSSNMLVLEDQLTWDEVNSEENQLKLVFKDGKFLKETTMAEIRERVKQIN